MTSTQHHSDKTKQTKAKFKQLYTKYGVLWKSLAKSDPDVLREYQSMVQILNELNKKNVKNNSNTSPSLSINESENHDSYRIMSRTSLETKSTSIASKDDQNDSITTPRASLGRIDLNALNMNDLRIEANTSISPCKMTSPLPHNEKSFSRDDAQSASNISHLSNNTKQVSSSEINNGCNSLDFHDHVTEEVEFLSDKDKNDCKISDETNHNRKETATEIKTNDSNCINMDEFTLNSQPTSPINTSLEQSESNDNEEHKVELLFNSTTKHSIDNDGINTPRSRDINGNRKRSPSILSLASSDSNTINGSNDFSSNSDSDSSAGNTVLAFDLSHLTINDVQINDAVLQQQDNHCNDEPVSKIVPHEMKTQNDDMTEIGYVIEHDVDERADEMLQVESSQSIPCNVETKHLSFAIQDDGPNELIVSTTTTSPRETNDEKVQNNDGGNGENQKRPSSDITASPCSTERGRSKSSCNSSSSGDTVIRFDLDESVFIDPIEVNEPNNQNDDIPTNLNEHEIIEEEDKFEADRSLSVASESSEEAEWTESEEHSCDESASSKEEEPKFNVIMLSSDESIDEDSYEDEEEGEDEDSYEEKEEGEENRIEEEDDDEVGLVLEEEVEEERYGYSSPVRTLNNLKSGNQTAKSALKFKNKREQLTKSTFDHFNQIVFGKKLESVEVTWSKRLTTTAGICRLKRRRQGFTIENLASIELSVKLIDDESRLQSTLMHEMCHAAAWLIDNVHKPPHGKVFKKWANLAMRRISGLIVSTTHEYVTNSYKFAWACTNEHCDFIIQRHSRSVDVNRHCCGKCRARLIEVEVPEPGSKVTSFTPKQKRQATGFSAFVQQKSKEVRLQLQASRDPSIKVSQKDVMKECGRLWREKKASEM